jgi:hypothetical protein
MQRSWTWVIPSLVVGGLAVGGTVLAPTMLARKAASSKTAAPKKVANGFISGRVVNEAGTPEAGVWVIAESGEVMPNDGRGADNFRKIVVTDDAGKYLVPDLPDAMYDVWVRGYGLKDSRPSWTVPGKYQVKPGTTDLEISVTRAKTPQEAAKVYPANFWYAMLQLPPVEAFPGDGKKIAKNMAHQSQWMGQLKLGCNLCHQIGTAATRLESRGAWDVALHKSPNMFGTANSFGYESLSDAFTDWSQRIQAGEVPTEAPPRPTGIERNVVITEWQIADLYAHPHDINSVDRRKPASNPNGPVYLVDYAQDWLIILDPVKNSWKRLRVPRHPMDKNPRQAYTALGTPVPGGHSNFNGVYDHSFVAPHNPMQDEFGRVWLTTRISSWRPDYCNAPGGGGAAEGGEGGGNRTGTGSFTMYDPKTGKFDVVPVCFGTHHLEFGDGPEGRLWTCSLGYLDTNKYDPDDPTSLQKAQGIADFMVDSDGDGKKDKKIGGGGYGIYPSPDGTAWNTQVGPYPGRINHFDPKTKVFETYQPPYGSGPRGIAVDSKGIVWTALGGSGHLARFDRKKCKQTWGMGDQCPEGWTLWKVPGPQFKGFVPQRPEDFASSTMLYFIWVDRYNSTGLGENTVIVNGTGADALFIFNPNTLKFMTVRVPYPLQYNSRGSDARVDDPNGGWKGKSLWSMYSSTSSVLTETNRPSMVKMQFRPDPLAQ